MILIAVLFLVPLYYISKSKGLNAAKLTTVATLLSIACTVASFFFPYVGFGQIIFPAIFLFSVWLIPRKGGAPGKQYLKIIFDCPECKAEVKFPRSKENTADLCPKCGEVIRIPMDEYSPKPSITERVKPSISSGHVCYANFGDEMLAAQMQALFEDNGIESEIIDGTGGGSLPQLGGIEGFKIAIDIEDWDKAVEIENLANQHVDLTPDGAGHM